MAFLLATVASFSNALSAVFQRIGLHGAPEASSMRLSLMTHALRRPIWFAGLGLTAFGFVCQAVALRFGQLSSVQLVVTTELLFLVLILWGWFRYRLTWRDWAGVPATIAGLSAFLLLARPGGGDVVPHLGDWLVVFAAVGGVVVVAIGLAQLGPRWFRAAMFGTAGSVLFALSAALTKVSATLVTHGWGHLFGNWEPYTLVGTGVVGLFLAQNAYHAGPITASQSTLTMVDPVASVVIGIRLFGDHLHAAGWLAPLEAVSLVVMLGGVFLLSQSPLVAGAKDETGTSDALTRQPSRRAREPVGGPAERVP